MTTVLVLTIGQAMEKLCAAIKEKKLEGLDTSLTIVHLTMMKAVGWATLLDQARRRAVAAGDTHVSLSVELIDRYLPREMCVDEIPDGTLSE